MVGSVRDAVAFLQWYAPGGPWVLTAIRPDRRSIDTQTYRRENLTALKTWLKGKIDGYNIYFHVNPCTRDLTKKAEREDVAALAWLHVDVDPRAGEDLAREQERALALLRDPPGNVPPPTCIIFSGGGYQGFWRLEEPLVIDGNLERAEDAKLYNLQLETIFGADNCHNVDRIMRLPGTINIPDARKKKKGRVPVQAELVEHHDDRTYPLGSFVKAVSLQSEDPARPGPIKVTVSGNVERITTDEMPETVNDTLKMIIVQGHDPDNPKKRDNSRSAWLFHAICHLLRAGLSDDQIYAIITDPDYGISASVLDKQRPESYAIRQIERAKEENEDPWLRKMNDRHAVIGNLGGRCRVITEDDDPVFQGRRRISRQSFDDLRNRYMHQGVEIGRKEDGSPIMVPLGKWWLSQPLRRQYDTMVFAPGRTVEGSYNLWKGFGVDARPGEHDLFLAHIRENICGGDQGRYEYVLHWMARCVQNPGEPGQVAVVLRGKQGTGKSLFATQFGALWGQHFMHVTDPKHLVGSFNSHLKELVVLFADEAFYAGDAKHASILKGLVTERTLTVEAKGVDAEVSPNFIHLIMASNAEWVVPAGLEERRFLVLDVAEDNMQNTGYFGAIVRQMEAGGRESLLYALMTMDLSSFEVRDVPKTEALRDQKQMSMSPELQWWHNILEDGAILPTHGGWQPEVPIAALYEDYVRFCQAIGVMRRQAPTSLGRFVKKACPPGWPTRNQRMVEVSVLGRHGEERVVNRRTWHYTFPSLGDLRVWFDQHYGGPYPWPEPPREQKEAEHF